MYLSWKDSKRRLREAENARKNRVEIVTAFSQGKITRRDIIKLGLFTAAGTLAEIKGWSPFARSAYAEIPTGAPPSPLPADLAFTQPMPRLEVLQRQPVSSLIPFPTRASNQTFNVAKGIGPVEGRPPGPDWEHQRFEEFFPKVAYEVFQKPIAPGFRWHPALPAQQTDKIWTFNGTFPPKLLKMRYGEPVLFRNHNALPLDPAANGGFGRNELTTHLHNGHTPAESDGFAGAFFFPGQFYDHRYPNILAGHDSINPDASDPRAGMPTDDGGVLRVPGNWRETLSTLWAHDHRFDFTSQNVYKGSALMANLYSAVDRGNEEINDGVNLQLPSGSALPWGNVDYDVNLMFADRAFDSEGQLLFDVFTTDGFLGDVISINGAIQPFFEVERRKYRFRIVNAAVSRFFKLALSDGSPMVLIATDGNLMERPLFVNELDEQGIAERFDVVIDFSRYQIGDKVWFVNLTEHLDGKGPTRDLTVVEALSGNSLDPGVGRALEFRVLRDPAEPDRSRVPATLIPLPVRDPTVRERTFKFGRSGGSDKNPWTIKTDGGPGLAFDVNRISAAPKAGRPEIWHLVNGGRGWDHPIHIHLEECQTLERNGGLPPEHERIGRKDVWRLGRGGRVKLYLRFREFTGTFVEHCHNTTHEDHALLLRWDAQRGPTPIPTPIPSPAGVTFEDPEILPTAL